MLFLGQFPSQSAILRKACEALLFRVHTYNSCQSGTACPARSTCTPMSCSCCTGCSASYIGLQLGVAKRKLSKRGELIRCQGIGRIFEKESSTIPLQKSADISNGIQTDRWQATYKQLHAALH